MALTTLYARNRDTGVIDLVRMGQRGEATSLVLSSSMEHALGAVIVDPAEADRLAAALRGWAFHERRRRRDIEIRRRASGGA